MRILENGSQKTQEVYVIYWFDWKKYFYCLPDGHNGFIAIKEDECTIVDPTISDFVLTKGDLGTDVFVHWAAHKGGLMYDLVDGGSDVAKEFRRRLKEDSFEEYRLSVYNQKQLFMERVRLPLEEIDNIANHEDNDLVDLNNNIKNLDKMIYIVGENTHENGSEIREMQNLYSVLYKEGEVFSEEDPPQFFMWNSDESKRIEINNHLDKLKKQLFEGLKYFEKVLPE